MENTVDSRSFLEPKAPGSTLDKGLGERKGNEEVKERRRKDGRCLEVKESEDA